VRIGNESVTVETKAEGALSGLNTALYGQQSNRGVAMREKKSVQLIKVS